jgi:hypothetical protein
MQSDPIGLVGDINTFRYTGNNPLNNFDNSWLDIGVFSLHEPREDRGTEAYFDAEAANKREFAEKYPLVEYLIGHAGPNYFGGYHGYELAEQLGNGLLKTGEIGTKTDYIQRMIKSRQPITIVLDGCNAGTPNWGKDKKYTSLMVDPVLRASLDTNEQIEDIKLFNNVAQDLGENLRKFVDNNGGKGIPIHIYAPSGFAYWWGSENPINDFITKSTMPTADGEMNSAGQWELYNY